MMKRRTFLVLAGSRLLPGTVEAMFHFQNNFWVNLHHFTRGESRRRSMNLPLGLPPADLSEKERSTWNAALDAYADLAKLNLIFDQRLIRINNALALRGGDSLEARIVEPKIADALNSAAPIYRVHLWERHCRDNAEWIERFAAEAERRAPAVTKALHVRWPTQPVLIDLACESGPNLAYTTSGPPGTAGHTVIAPLQNQIPEVALETIFHEASHTIDADIG